MNPYQELEAEIVRTENEIESFAHTLKLGNAVESLDTNPDFILLMDDLKESLIQHSINTSNPTLKDSATCYVTGIGHFLNIYHMYMSTTRSAKDRIESLEAHLVELKDELAKL